jgi:hypothetical protein
MDVVKRAATRLRRLQASLTPKSRTPPPQGPFSALAISGGRTSLRQIIDDTVVAFVPPILPIISGTLTCDAALLEFYRPGFGADLTNREDIDYCSWTLNVHVQSSDTAPTIFCFGFTTKRGYVAGFIGAVNYAPAAKGSKSDKLSATPSATCSVWGPSPWIANHWSAAVQEGVEFRLLSSTDLEGTIESFTHEWERTFDVEWHRALNMFDDDTEEHRALFPREEVNNELAGIDYVVSVVDGGGDQGAGDEGGDEPGASFEVSISFD